MGDVIRFEPPVNWEENAVSAFVELQRNFRSVIEITSCRVYGKRLRPDRSILLFFADKLIHALVKLDDHSGALQSTGDIVDGLEELELGPDCSDLELGMELGALSELIELLKEELAPRITRYQGTVGCVELGTRMRMATVIDMED